MQSSSLPNLSSLQPEDQGSYDQYGLQYGQSIEWATPRILSSYKKRSVAATGLSSRNLMMDKSFSEPSSPHLLHKDHPAAYMHRGLPRAEGQGYSKPDYPVKQVSSSSSSSNEDINSMQHVLSRQSCSDSIELAELLASQQELKLQNMNMVMGGCNPLRKWSSCTGLVNKGEYGDESIPESHGTSVSPVQLVTTRNAAYPGYQNMPYGSSASVAYVAPLRQDTHTVDDTPHDTSTPSGTTSTDDDKLDSLIKAKDELIRQKDKIIERQKKSISQLQQHQFNMDAKLQHALLMRSCDQEGVVTLKLQEYQYETAQLRAHLSQITADKDTEIDRMQKKLGETEYLLDRMDACVKETAALKGKDVDAIQYKLLEKDKANSELKVMLEKSKQEHQSVRRRMESLERYLSDVPTVEEHQKTLKTLKDVRDECVKMQDIVSSKEKKLAQMNKAYGLKSEEGKKLHKQNKALKEKVESQEKYLEKYKNNGPVSEIEFEDLKMENDRLQAELTRTKKVLEAKHKKMKALHEQTQKDQKGLEERLAQEENTVVALRDEVTARDNSVRELRKSLRELASQNQDMMEQNLNLKSVCQKYEKANSKEKVEASKRLWKELSRCLSELKSVIQLCTARKNGEDPNMSLLLGIKGTSCHLDEFDETTDDVEGVRTKILKIRELQSEIDALRTFVSDQYAEDVGNNCTTQ